MDWDDVIVLDNNGNPVYDDTTGTVTTVDGGGAQIVITTVDMKDPDIAGQSNNVSVSQIVDTYYDQDSDANTGVQVYTPITPEELGHYDYSGATNPNNPTLTVNDGVASMVTTSISDSASSGGVSQEEHIENIVGGLYVTHLGRIPDSQGQAYWVDDIVSLTEGGMSLDDAIAQTENAFSSHPDVVSTGTIASAAAGLPSGTTISSLVVADSSLIQYGGPSGINYTDSAISGEYTGSTDWDSQEIQNHSIKNQIANQVIGATATWNDETGQLEAADVLGDALNGAWSQVAQGNQTIDEAVADLLAVAANPNVGTTAASICADDPLAQSFFVTQEEGIFVTSIDVYFGSKDETLPVVVQLRPMQLGLPTQQIYPFSEVVVDPQYVYVSDDASVATRITFDGPVYLAGGQYHSVVLLSASNNYTAWISRMGETDITSANRPESDQIIISEQPLLLSLIHI